MKNLFYIAVALLLLTSCKSLLKKSYAVKDPKLEDQVSIKMFLHKKKIDTSNVYVFNNLMAYAGASNLKLLSIPDAVFFNKEGFFVSYKKSATDCNAKIDGFISDLSSFSQLPKDETKKMDDLVALINNNNNTIPTKADINVFITWAVFAGKLNDEKAFEWVKLLNDAKKKGINVNYYLLNCDFQKSWNLSKEEKEGIGIKE
jgi:hypothetical protein